jgi:hypothetical protein
VTRRNNSICYQSEHGKWHWRRSSRCR